LMSHIHSIMLHKSIVFLPSISARS